MDCMLILRSAQGQILACAAVHKLCTLDWHAGNSKRTCCRCNCPSHGTFDLWGGGAVQCKQTPLLATTIRQR
eukprot:scaffold307743_cov14-Tisochrysis_lutea.AAC.1